VLVEQGYRVTMHQLNIDPSFYITASADGTFHSGRVFHISRNSSGGSTSTPVGYYFVWRPDIGAEGYHLHWRVDCFVRDHQLAPSPRWLGTVLADALLSTASVSEPLWISWHSSKELAGEARGQVFDD
jgi:hypothetical protein